MFNITDSVNIWVSPKAPQGGMGTVELPFSTIDEAVEKVVEGSRIVLMPGTYEEKVSLREVKGSEMKPISIVALPDRKEPVICTAEWFLYDITDLIISGITFETIENSAVSILGTSERNIIKGCHFDRCGENSECAVFIGGNSGRFNVIEECTFASPEENNEKQIALFVAQSIDEEDDTLRPSSHTIIRYNQFKNYGVGVVVGSADELEAYGNHLIEENLFDTCFEGVRSKASGTTIKANIFKECAKAISALSGEATEILENRFDTCALSISCGTFDVTISQNCFINSTCTIMPEGAGSAIVLHNNTMVSTQQQAPVLDIQTETIVAITDSVFDGIDLKFTESVTAVGCITSQSSDVKGISTTSLHYKDSAHGDFSLTIAQGCSSSAAFVTEINPVPQVEVAPHTHNHDEGDDEPTVKGDLDERDLYLQTFFHDDEGIEDEENEPIIEAMSLGQQPLRPIGEDGELEDN